MFTEQISNDTDVKRPCFTLIGSSIHTPIEWQIYNVKCVVKQKLRK